MKNGSKPAAVVGSGAVVVAGSPENEKNITENIYQVFNYFTKNKFKFIMNQFKGRYTYKFHMILDIAQERIV